MEFKDIKQLASLMKDMGLTSLEYSEGDASVKMERGAVLSAAPAVAAPKAEEAAAQPEANSGAYTITSPMVGVFYAAPAADKKPYVSIGDRVEAGDVLCIIEAMKMMNEITSEKSGVIAEICAGNKQIVEYGHPLFRLSLDE
ncbi:acetyl-CoA carboxylase biotin carboxyl carrier protein [Sporobacter termitidis]|nr:acetyl-CoA carboxylase biotin carboxyl carrier protein [Sporobacter termitidis]